MKRPTKQSLRKTLLLLWLLFPVLVAAYHFNFGQKQVARERAYDRLQAIRRMQAEDEPDWAAIIEAYQQVVEELPADENRLVFQQIQLAVCEARIEMLDLERAIEDLTLLLRETATDHGENAPITRAVREQLGKAHYYATWVLRTNNAPEAEWRPYAERARQLFRYLAELEEPEEYALYEDRVREEFEKAKESKTP